MQEEVNLANEKKVSPGVAKWLTHTFLNAESRQRYKREREARERQMGLEQLKGESNDE